MDNTCADCGVPIGHRGTRCKKHSAVERWRVRAIPRFCKVCKNQILSRSRARAIYCSVACKFSDPELLAKIGGPKRQVTKACPHCGRDFSVPVCHWKRYDFCSRSCSRAARGRDEVCRRCGAAFRHGRSSIRAYCSEVCRRPPIRVNCEHCGNGFRVVPSRAQVRRYCCQRCYMASGVETTIERAVRLELESARLAFTPQAQIGSWIVDFLVGQLVIEADGSYWHTLRPHVDRRKTAELTERGYVVWRLTEVEIRHVDFGAALQARLVEHESTFGDLPRMTPDQLIAFDYEDRMIPRYEQLALAL